MAIILKKYNLDFSIAKLLQFVCITKLSLGLACLQVGELLLAKAAGCPVDRFAKISGGF